MTLSPHQALVLDTILKHRHICVLNGVAGTGKTTLAAELGRRVKCQYAAYTGKATHRLKQVGCAHATTVHRLLYRCDRAPWGFKFTWCPSVNRDTDLIVVDEASMLPDAMLLELCSLGKPVVFIRDPFQLPPVSGEHTVLETLPQLHLTEVHRQALESPVLRLATAVRQGDPWQYPKSRDVGQADIVLCGLNKTRMRLNAALSPHKTCDAVHPGDRVVALANTAPVFNGSLWTLTEHGGLTDGEQIHNVDCALRPATWRRGVVPIDLAYCLTVHKAQGSEWPHVALVYKEASSFREFSARWLYTGITRARETLTLLDL